MGLFRMIATLHQVDDTDYNNDTADGLGIDVVPACLLFRIQELVYPQLRMKGK